MYQETAGVRDARILAEPTSNFDSSRVGGDYMVSKVVDHVLDMVTIFRITISLPICIIAAGWQILA
jgi:hypothetical protein